MDFAKTSTGFAGGGATPEDVKLMRQHLPPTVRIKAAGGVRTLDALLEVRSIGIARIGATRSAKMLQECKRRLGLPLEAAMIGARRSGLYSEVIRRPPDCAATVELRGKKGLLEDSL